MFAIRQNEESLDYITCTSLASMGTTASNALGCRSPLFSVASSSTKGQVK